MYFLAVNRAKPNVEPTELGGLLHEHIEWVRRHLATGDLVQVGKWGDHGGMAIIQANSEAKARDLLGSDPLIRSGMFSVEIGEFHPDVEQVRYVKDQTRTHA